MKQIHLILLLVSFFTFSQNKELDSLEQIVENYKKRDTVKVNLLNKLSDQYIATDISKSKELINEAVEISKQLNNTQSLIKSYSNLASYYVVSGEYDQALQLSLKTKKLQEKNNDLEGVVFTNGNIARVYNHMGKTDDAIKIHLENLDLLKEKKDGKALASTHFYLATAYSEKESFNKAEKHYIHARKIAEKENLAIGIAISNSSLGVLENKRKNYKKAIDYLTKSLGFYKTNKQAANIAHTKLELAVAYANTGNIDKAISLNNDAIVIYKRQKNFKSLQRAYFEQNDYYKQKKDYLNSSKNLELYYAIRDSLFSKEKTIIIEEMTAKFETDKIKSEKDLAEKQLQISILESSKNRNLFIGSSIIAGLILLLSLIYYSRFKAKKQAEIITLELKETQKRLALEKQYKDSELKALKAQMNPHFIFNALNSIQDYIVLNQKNLASDYLGKFADLIRNYLHFSDTGFISIPEEVHNLKLYLGLEKLRFEEALDYQLTIDNKVNSETIKIPTMLIQPYVENALKHGLLHKKDNRKLSISISKSSEKIIQCIVQDNGIGREKSKELNKKREHQHKSFALKATTERLDLLNYGKEQKIGVEIIDLKYGDEATGTKVILNIPIVNK